MQSLPQFASDVQTISAYTAKPAKRDDRLYQAVTIAAMLIVLVSVWVF